MAVGNSSSLALCLINFLYIRLILILIGCGGDREGRNLTDKFYRLILGWSNEGVAGLLYFSLRCPLLAAHVILIEIVVGCYLGLATNATDEINVLMAFAVCDEGSPFLVNALFKLF
jgi:hypothetical protein